MATEPDPVIIPQDIKMEIPEEIDQECAVCVPPFPVQSDSLINQIDCIGVRMVKGVDAEGNTTFKFFGVCDEPAVAPLFQGRKVQSDH